MLYQLLACADGPEERAEAFLDEHPMGTAIVRVGLDAPGFSAAVGGPLPHTSETLGEWLAPCGDVEAFDAEIVLKSGRFPWDVGGSASPCARERLSTLPLDPPVPRGARDLVVVRWRPAEPVDRVLRIDQDGISSVGRALVPPYQRVADGVPGDRWDVDLVDDQVHFRTAPGGFHHESSLEAPEEWARRLTCPGGDLRLVRVVIELREGGLQAVRTVPEDDCVEARVPVEEAWMLTRRAFPGGRTLADVDHVLVVIDVPVGPW